MSLSLSSSTSLMSTFLFTTTLFLLILTNFLAIVNTSHCLAAPTAATSEAEAAKNATGRRHRDLSVDHYAKTCPDVEKLVGSITSKLFEDSPAIAPATIRLFFHDCFIEGCDASIMISSKAGSKDLVEKDATENKNLPAEAFDSINQAKALVESTCPGVVSCADILAISARDYVRLAGGPHYEVKKGRWDGRISKASLVSPNLPRVNSTMDEIINLFTSKGLTLQDLVVLSGAHTIGYAHCKSIMNRIYYYKGTKHADPNIDRRLLKALRLYCPRFGGNEDIVVPFDVTTPFKFDNEYYGNLKGNMGLLVTDQALVLDPRTKPIVEAFATDKQRFFDEFGRAMEKMGSIGVKRGPKHGEKRKVCTSHM